MQDLEAAKMLLVSKDKEMHTREQQHFEELSACQTELERMRRRAAGACRTARAVVSRGMESAYSHGQMDYFHVLSELKSWIESEEGANGGHVDGYMSSVSKK